ncbi:TetR/AcrR family transcriptional regulator [Desulfoscipio gibsoniae]|uniref:Transcriptional regulator n=1 Tax=Desulfoscipio gibsoniae DSM 7213 TaxID=767817 RepID=R4KEF7_9FIRM|nr:TetR/AcrR family transcriptional regulator [Desulfoscipio gibsoniae]AGL00032.1 transcriptional regulator [Desulfoscipio gibsoniae DSM 7213]
MAGRKEEIIKVATVLFSKNGYDNTSIRELAKACELSVAGLYYFFQNKEDILFNILNSSLDRLMQYVSSAINKNDSPQTNIKRIIDHGVQCVMESKMEIGLLLKESPRLNPEQQVIIKNNEREVIHLIRNEISRLNDEGSLKNFNLTFLAFSIWSIISFSHNWFNPEGQLSTKGFVTETTELFFNGVLK